MKWSSSGKSSNIEDRRGSGGFGGGGGMAPMGIGGAVLLLVLSLIFGRDFVSGGDEPTSSGGDVAPPAAESPSEKKEVEFVGFVLDTAQATWRRLLPQMGA